MGSSGSSDVKESACNAEDLGSIPGLKRSPGGGYGNPLQYSCLENPMDRGGWQATVHGVTKSQRTEWVTHVRAPGSMGSVVVARGLNCPVAWKLARPGIGPVSPALAGRFSTVDPQGSPGPNASFVTHLERTEKITYFLHIFLSMTYATYMGSLSEDKQNGDYSLVWWKRRGCGGKTGWGKAVRDGNLGESEKASEVCMEDQSGCSQEKIFEARYTSYSLSQVWLFVTLWTAVRQAPLSMGFSVPWEEYWSGLPCPPPGDLPNPGIKPRSPILQAAFFTSLATREAQEYWSALPFPSPGELPDPAIKLGSPALLMDSLPAELPGKPLDSDQICSKFSSGLWNLFFFNSYQIYFCFCDHPPIPIFAGQWLSETNLEASLPLV